MKFGIYKGVSNCLIFAVARLWRSGGYLIFRRSSYGWWPHVIWSQDLLEFEEFTTTDKFHRWSPPVIFKGFIKRWIPSRSTTHAKSRSKNEP